MEVNSGGMTIRLQASDTPPVQGRGQARWKLSCVPERLTGGSPLSRSLTRRMEAQQGGEVTRALTSTDPALRRCWHPVARTEDVLDHRNGVMLLGEPWVLYRSAGTVRAFADRCPTGTARSHSAIAEGGVLQCAYHGWRFDESGRCVENPGAGGGGDPPFRPLG